MGVHTDLQSARAVPESIVKIMTTHLNLYRFLFFDLDTSPVDPRHTDPGDHHPSGAVLLESFPIMVAAFAF